MVSSRGRRAGNGIAHGDRLAQAARAGEQEGQAVACNALGRGAIDRGDCHRRRHIGPDHRERRLGGGRGEPVADRVVKGHDGLLSCRQHGIGRRIQHEGVGCRLIGHTRRQDAVLHRQHRAGIDIAHKGERIDRHRCVVCIKRCRCHTRAGVKDLDIDLGLAATQRRAPFRLDPAVAQGPHPVERGAGAEIHGLVGQESPSPAHLDQVQRCPVLEGPDGRHAVVQANLPDPRRGHVRLDPEGGLHRQVDAGAHEDDRAAPRIGAGNRELDAGAPADAAPVDGGDVGQRRVEGLGPEGRAGRIRQRRQREAGRPVRLDRLVRVHIAGGGDAGADRPERGCVHSRGKRRDPARAAGRRVILDRDRVGGASRHGFQPDNKVGAGAGPVPAAQADNAALQVHGRPQLRHRRESIGHGQGLDRERAVIQRVGRRCRQGQPEGAAIQRVGCPASLVEQEDARPRSPRKVRLEIGKFSSGILDLTHTGL